MKNFADQIEELKSKITEEEWKEMVANAKKLAEELGDDIETIKSTKAEVIAKPKDVEELADKAKASKMTEEEIKKHIEDNVIDEFND